LTSFLLFFIESEFLKNILISLSHNDGVNNE